MSYRIAVDSGGTFTDGILIDHTGKVISQKAHSTPQDPTIGTLNCIGKLARDIGLTTEELLGDTTVLTLGTTVATNIIATHKGANLGLITTQGFRLRMTAPQVPKSEWAERPLPLAEFHFDEPRPLAEWRHMTEIKERVNYKGEELVPLDEDSVREAIAHLKKEKVDSIAVCLMFSPLNPEHELRVGEIVREEYPEAFVTLSSTVLPVIGEVERWSTTMFSAYVAPTVTKYVDTMEAALKENNFQGSLLFMQSNGGVATPDIVRENPAIILLSGPSAGPTTGLSLGKEHGFENICSVDMGGTSFDIGMAHDGVVDIATQKIIDAKKFNLPTVDVTILGAGGGSIAHIDTFGKLDVGPQSAAAYPGPACYGNGGEDPTVTDANLVLGYIDPNFFLGGESKLYKEEAEKAIKEKVADPLGLTVEEGAMAIYDVVNAKMAGAMQLTFASHGYDTRDFIVCGAGGAAAIHAMKISEELGIKTVIIPKLAPVYCAYGMQFCDLKHDFQKAYFSYTEDADLGKISDLYEEMKQKALDTLKREGVAEEDAVINRFMEMRYYGQFRTRLVNVPDGEINKDLINETVKNFHVVHKNTVGYSDDQYPTEIMMLKLTATAKGSEFVINDLPEGDGNVARALKGSRRAYSPGSGFIETNVYDGRLMLTGDIIEGPGIIEETFTTIVVPDGCTASVDRQGNYLISKKEG